MAQTSELPISPKLKLHVFDISVESQHTDTFVQDWKLNLAALLERA